MMGCYGNPLYKPDISPLEFHLFDALRVALCGESFGCSDNVEGEAVSTRFKPVQERGN
jgi:hypothetical protein